MIVLCPLSSHHLHSLSLSLCVCICLLTYISHNNTQASRRQASRVCARISCQVDSSFYSSSWADRSLYSATTIMSSDRPSDGNAATRALFTRNNSHRRRSSLSSVPSSQNTPQSDGQPSPQFRQIRWSSEPVQLDQQLLRLDDGTDPPLSPRQSSSPSSDAGSTSAALIPRAVTTLTPDQSGFNNFGGTRKKGKRKSAMTEPRARAARHKGQMNFPSERT